jgi:hypothetical protein
VSDPKLILPDESAAPNFAAPSGPPTPMARQVPDWFRPVYEWINGVVRDEGLVLDLCLERAIEIAEFNHNRGMVGIDHFMENQIPPRTQMVAFAVPLATELYRQVLASIDQHKGEFSAILKAALEKRPK